MPTPSRQLLHQTVLDDHRDAHPDVRHERRAIVMAGPPGAGKTAVRRRFIREVLGQAEADFVVIDADEFKTALMRHALADGSYQSWLTPPEVTAVQGTGQRVYPLEMSALVHQESVLLAQAARRIAVRHGDDLVIDTVLQNAASAMALGRQLQEAGYTISVLDAECSFKVSTSRIRARWAQTFRDAVAGRDLLGGRWVPSEYAHEVFGGPGGTSRPEAAAAALAAQCLAVIRYQVHRASAGNAPAVLDVDLARLDLDSKLMPADAVAAARLQAHAPGSRNVSQEEPQKSATQRGQVDRGGQSPRR